jgi:hypothetical protein
MRKILLLAIAIGAAMPAHARPELRNALGESHAALARAAKVATSVDPSKTVHEVLRLGDGARDARRNGVFSFHGFPLVSAHAPVACEKMVATWRATVANFHDYGDDWAVAVFSIVCLEDELGESVTAVSGFFAPKSDAHVETARRFLADHQDLPFGDAVLRFHPIDRFVLPLAVDLRHVAGTGGETSIYRHEWQPAFATWADAVTYWEKTIVPVFAGQTFPSAARRLAKLVDPNDAERLATYFLKDAFPRSNELRLGYDEIAAVTVDGEPLAFNPGLTMIWLCADTPTGTCQ